MNAIIRGQPIDIQGGARKIRRQKIIYLMSKRHNIFFTYSVTEYIHGAWVQIFFSPFLRRNLFTVVPAMKDRPFCGHWVVSRGGAVS